MQESLKREPDSQLIHHTFVSPFLLKEKLFGEQAWVHSRGDMTLK